MGRTRREGKKKRYEMVQRTQDWKEEEEIGRERELEKGCGR